ncbi:GntR family transcriptional regulator [Pelomonas sp. SE-A7]|uniref:GntR family transcriptional regulator n=1 Tax=Pelomonas sp. SE-A7 TaxID=3054953 RepID=UPI00259CCD02|nr:GntR family transcriptional regulator [Pelomonas sp. SE-A7]MDM4765495.1 GntR family transcriptional regulator [Pelomonas sp. SE-A7]
MPASAPLIIDIRPGDARPIARQIVDAIRRQIAAGELQAGDALPSVRGLAQQLLINPNTVARAYQELGAEGWVDARAGLGLFVAEQRQRLSRSEQQRRLGAACERFVDEVIALDLPNEQVVERLSAELERARPGRRSA